MYWRLHIITARRFLSSPPCSSFPDPYQVEKRNVPREQQRASERARKICRNGLVAARYIGTVGSYCVAPRSTSQCNYRSDSRRSASQLLHPPTSLFISLYWRILVSPNLYPIQAETFTDQPIREVVCYLRVEQYTDPVDIVAFRAGYHDRTILHKRRYRPQHRLFR